MVELINLLTLFVAGILAFGAAGFVLWRTIKKSLKQEIKIQAIESVLKRLGVQKVDSKFFNDLSEEGMKRCLTMIFSMLQYERQNNPLGITGGLPKSIQSIIALANLGQQQAQPQSQAEQRNE